jgi:Immunity protein 26
MSAKKVPLGPPGTMLLDDRWLNEVERWLASTAVFCERTFGRKPSIEDLRALLSTVLTAGSDRAWFSDGDHLVVKKVAFKTAPRPAVPKKLQPGHVLAIPLGKTTYAFARVMMTDPAWLIGAIVEVFRKTMARPEYDRTVVASGRAFRPLCINPVSCIESGRWKVVGFDEGYRVAKEDTALEFPAAPSGVFTATLPFDRGRLGRTLTTAAFWKLTEETDGDAKEVERRIRQACRGSARPSRRTG